MTAITTQFRKFSGWTLPANRRSPRAWDAFWTDVISSAPNPAELADGRWSPPGPHGDKRDGRYFGPIRGYTTDICYARELTQWRARGHRRVLIPGCGLDVLPYFCEHRGFETVALDVSSRAIQYQRAHPPGPGWWRFWVCYSDLDHTGELLTRSEAELAELRAAEHIAGGSVDFRVADAFDLSAETGQWDVAITRNLVEHYEAEDRRTLLAGLFACLRPGGTMILETERRALPESEDGELQPYPEVEDVGFVTPYRRVAEWHQDHILGSMEYEEFDRQRSPVMSEAIAEEDEAIRGGRRVAVVYSH